MRNRKFLTQISLGLILGSVVATSTSLVSREAVAQTTPPAEESKVSPLACLHTMLEQNQIHSSGPAQGKMPTMLDTTPPNLLFRDDDGTLYTIEWPHLYKLATDPSKAKPGSILVTDMRPDHKLHHTTPTSVWQFVTPKGVTIAVHSVTEGGKTEYGVRRRDHDLKKVDGLIAADQGMKTANENALREANCADLSPSLSDKVADLTAPLAKVSIGREMSTEEAKKDWNDFKKKNATEKAKQYGDSIAESQKWRKDLEATRNIEPQPNSAVQLQSEDVEKKLASDMIPKLKSQLDGLVNSKNTVDQIRKYCGPEMIPTQKGLTDQQKAKNQMIDLLNEGAEAPIFDGWKESNDPK